MFVHVIAYVFNLYLCEIGSKQYLDEFGVCLGRGLVVAHTCSVIFSLWKLSVLAVIET